ncbi:hypothetical protein SAMN04488692_10376 [Halarsenatibacter silvermanii]|uniref:Uncharacterized protein n=1 Tax=Halarsenatibacter silvermanii TaxID=321763 RepID=A0A1G9IWJ8_9FIRM|nr:hypothetical protein SAMN04488692_10376 [Halarsenatibacter silvermanii]
MGVDVSVERITNFSRESLVHVNGRGGCQRGDKISSEVRAVNKTIFETFHQVLMEDLEVDAAKAGAGGPILIC